MCTGIIIILNLIPFLFFVTSYKIRVNYLTTRRIKYNKEGEEEGQKNCVRPSTCYGKVAGCKLRPLEAKVSKIREKTRFFNL